MVSDLESDKMTKESDMLSDCDKSAVDKALAFSGSVIYGKDIFEEFSPSSETYDQCSKIENEKYFASEEVFANNKSKPASEKKADSETTARGASFDIPRTLLTVQQAAAILGKSVRALERSLMGRWGNKLPDGWSARKIKTEKGEEWRIVPPPGFRVKTQSSKKEEHSVQEILGEDVYNVANNFLGDLGFGKRQIVRAENNTVEHATIVIDRSDEVEHLLRELLVTQKALSEERRMHMEELRGVAQLQGSLRLLESAASESSRAKLELESTRKELELLKTQYSELVSLPWWKRIFGFAR